MLNLLSELKKICYKHLGNKHAEPKGTINVNLSTKSRNHLQIAMQLKDCASQLKTECLAI